MNGFDLLKRIAEALEKQNGHLEEMVKLQREQVALQQQLLGKDRPPRVVGATLQQHLGDQLPPELVSSAAPARLPSGFVEAPGLLDASSYRRTVPMPQDVHEDDD